MVWFRSQYRPVPALRNSFLTSLLVALAACGGSDNSDLRLPSHGLAGGRVIQGQVAKGPLDGATVRVFAIDGRGNTLGNPVAITLTDSGGNWQALLPDNSQSYVAVSSGGRYVDEADPEPDPALRRSVQLSDQDQLQALVPAGSSFAVINIFTDALFRKSLVETEGANFAAVHAINREFFTRAFGFDLSTTLPADPIAPDSGSGFSAVQYGMALGGIANVVNAYAIAAGKALPDFATIDAVIADFTDCEIDANGVDGAVNHASVPTDLNTEILRFRNNNAAAYTTVPVLQVDTAECARSGRLPDSVAPVINGVPQSLTLAAVDAGGTPSAQLAALLTTVTAIDDRDGIVDVVLDAPAVLPLGASTIAVTATDQSGNVTEQLLAVNVVDLDAPAITAPASVDVMATGALTAVSLGVPAVSDNVTPAAELVVVNDAPAAGFAVGTYSVTWTVTDAAGLSAEASQQVIVRNQAPQLVTPIGNLQATEGTAVTFQLGSAFVDSDSSLSFTLTGLPAGSGLLFDPASGQLAGSPNDIDAQAAPLLLSITAMDETTSVSDAFVLEVVDINNAPQFSVAAELQLIEDFSPLVVSVTAGPSDGPEPVTYSIDPGSVDFASLSIDPVSGTVTISSLPDANGQGSFMVSADDGGSINNLYSQQVTLTVESVNDAPRFSLDGDVAVVPGFNGVAVVTATPVPPPADEQNQPVTYSIAHSIAYAEVAIDNLTGTVSISAVADVSASAVIEVIADDGQAANSSHSELLTFVVRESDKLLYAGEPVDPQQPPIVPVFPDPLEQPLWFNATNLPPSLQIDMHSGSLSGTPTAEDVAVGTFDSAITVTGSQGSVATFGYPIRVVERDTDLDGLPDRFEPDYGTNPLVADSDGDGIVDGVEVAADGDPLRPRERLVSVEQWSTQAGSASAESPLFITLPPGVYDQPLPISPPCDHIRLIGGVTAEQPVPDPKSPTLLRGGVSLDGCTDVVIAHILVVAGAGLAISDSSVAVVNSVISSGDSAGLHLTGSQVSVRDSILQAADSLPLLDANHSRVTMEQGLLRTAAGSLVVQPDASVALFDVESRADIAGRKNLSVINLVHRRRVTPDHARVVALSGEMSILSMRFGQHPAGPGQPVTAFENGQPLAVYDISNGHYLLGAEYNDSVMLFVDDKPVPIGTPSRQSF